MYLPGFRRSSPFSSPVLSASALALLLACAPHPTGATKVDQAEPALDARVEGDVRFTIETRESFPISPFVYGINSYEQAWGGARIPRGVTLQRMGGNRLSAYNWENNASNAGSDYRYQNDGHMGGGEVPGEAVRQRVETAFAADAAVVVTVPMLGHVAADKNGPTGADEASLATRLRTRFRESRPAKGAAFSMQPDLGDAYVYQDEFVWWLDRKFPGAHTDPTRRIFYTLDNEPDIWHKTHEQVRSKVNGQDNLLTYDDLVKRTVAHAAAIKAVAPGAVVFGGGLTNYSGVTTLGRWPSPDPQAGNAEFLPYYLDRMREAERTHGRRLLDVLDLHWYTEVNVAGRRLTDDSAPQTAATIEARVQAPRSLWDPSYDEGSWVNQVTRGPIRLLPRLRDMVASRYPGTRIAISEYYYGRAGDISGGIAQADALGVFGKEGVFAASVWPAAELGAYGGDGNRAYAFLLAAFRMYRDYDGQGGRFGDTGVAALNTDAVRSSVYASIDPTRPERVVIVAINKTDKPLAAAIEIRNHRALSRAEVYTLTADSPSPVRRADLAMARPDAGRYLMPPMSVSTLVLR